jgi:hypothetical protein
VFSVIPVRVGHKKRLRTGIASFPLYVYFPVFMAANRSVSFVILNLQEKIIENVQSN